MFETAPPKNLMNIEPYTPSGRMAPTFQLLSNREIQSYYKNIIDEWEPISDVWAVRIAPWCMTAVIAVSSGYVNHLFRRKLNLRDIGLAASMFSTGGMSGILFFLADGFARRRILENNYCPACMHARYAVSYSGFAVLLPLVTAPAVNLHHALQNGYDVPRLFEIQRVRKFWWSIVKPAIPTLSLLTAGFAVLGLFMSYHTMDSIHFVHWVIAKMHRDYLKTFDEVRDKHEQGLHKGGVQL